MGRSARDHELAGAATREDTVEPECRPNLCGFILGRTDHDDIP